MQAQVTTERAQHDPRAREERRGEERARGDDDRTREDRERGALGADERAHPDRLLAVDEDPLDVGPHRDARAVRARVLEPRAQRALLGARAAAEVAEAAALVLVTAPHVARHRRHRQAELLGARLHQPIAGPRSRLVRRDPDARAHRVERRAQRSAREHAGEAGLAIPLRAHVVGQAQRRRVVHHRAATERLAAQQGDAEIGARAGVVQIAIGIVLVVGEVALGRVATALEDHDVEPRRGQHRRGGAAPRARSHHDDVTRPRGGPRDRLGAQPVRCVGGRCLRPGIAHRLVHHAGRAIEVGPRREQRGQLGQEARGGALQGLAPQHREDRVLDLVRTETRDRCGVAQQVVRARTGLERREQEARAAAIGRVETRQELGEAPPGERAASGRLEGIEARERRQHRVGDRVERSLLGGRELHGVRVKLAPGPVALASIASRSKRSSR